MFVMNESYYQLFPDFLPIREGDVMTRLRSQQVGGSSKSIKPSADSIIICNHHSTAFMYLELKMEYNEYEEQWKMNKMESKRP